MIRRSISDVAEVSLGITDASASLSVGGGSAMAFAALTISRKGMPNTVLKVNANNLLNVLGKPFHPREGSHAESLRHISDATKGGDGHVVRVMPSNALYPVLTVGAATVNVNEVVAQTLAYGIEPTLTGDELLAIYLIDGDNELTRKITLTTADAAENGAGFYELTLNEVQADSSIKVLETTIVSLDINATDENGNSAFIEDKLSTESAYLRAISDVSKLNNFEAINETAFAGGTSGDVSTITTADYQKALAILIAEEPEFQGVIAAGCYDDTMLGELNTLAYNNNVSFYYDIEPNLSFVKAIDRQRSLAMNSHFAQAYHLPYTATDHFYAGKSMCGISGFVFAAKAKGVATKSPTGGWHLTPAGESRATITRKGLQLNANAGTPDYADFVKVRLNRLGKNSAGQLMIDDALTTRARKDQLRFDNIVSVDNAIGRDWIKLGKSLKHEPDGVTRKGLNDGMTRILDGYVSSDCLVIPRDPSDGESPYKFVIEQIESDLWKVTWDICISGSARRLIGQPRLLK